MSDKWHFLIGWASPGLVELNKEWCIYCQKNRWHETMQGHKCCLACANVVQEEQPNFQIERFIKENYETN